MPSYVIAHHGCRKFQTREDGAAHMAKWQAWVGGLDDAVVNPDTPLGNSKTVSSRGVSDSGSLKANGMDAALTMVRACRPCLTNTPG